MWGIVPAAGIGSRIQPLAFSKELLPVGSRTIEGGERPCAVSEYLVERMVNGGADKICFVISPGKHDILGYFGERYGEATICYVVQSQPAGLCDAIFKAARFIPDHEEVLVGLPDTVWFPADGFAALPADRLSFLLFPVDHPEFFDAVKLGEAGRVLQIEVKQPDPSSHWVWGAFRMPARILHDLHALWRERQCRDEYMGSLVNAWIAAGGETLGVKAGTSYVDVGTLHGYRAALQLLTEMAAREARASVSMLRAPAAARNRVQLERR
jgi:glucose-1-phosphate thymidylyltransferase